MLQASASVRRYDVWAIAAVQWPLSSTSANAPPTHGKESHLVRNCSHLWCVAFYLNSGSQRMEVTTIYTQIFYFFFS
ncbi:mCG1047628 [Mus musculus]|nr:mCG1047628 [Mus musculus]